MYITRLEWNGGKKTKGLYKGISSCGTIGENIEGGRWIESFINEFSENKTKEEEF